MRVILCAVVALLVTCVSVSCKNIDPPSPIMQPDGGAASADDDSVVVECDDSVDSCGAD